LLGADFRASPSKNAPWLNNIGHAFTFIITPVERLAEPRRSVEGNLVAAKPDQTPL
jgi:hypothetical protein